MNRYIATFHTHFSALCTLRALEGASVEARMAPVPRALSSSCGTCVKYISAAPQVHLMHADVERIVLEDGEAYRLVVQYD